MNISKKVLKIIKIKLSNCKNIHKYTSAYQETFNVFSLITKNLELITKRVSMILQAALFKNMGPKYIGIVFTIELEWKDKTTNLENTIFQFVKFEEIWKKNSKTKEKPFQPIIFLSSSGSTNPDNARAFKETCINSDYIKRGITSHFIENCFWNILSFTHNVQNTYYAKWDLKAQKQNSKIKTHHSWHLPENFQCEKYDN